MKMIATTINGFTSYQPLSVIERLINEARVYCAAELKSAPHAIYASKKYDASGELDHVHIYGCVEVDEAEFDRIAKLPDVYVYAMHQGTSY